MWWYPVASLRCRRKCGRSRETKTSSTPRSFYPQSLPLLGLSLPSLFPPFYACYAGYIVQTPNIDQFPNLDLWTDLE